MSIVISSEPLPDDPVALQALVRGQRERIAELEQRLAWFVVQYRLVQHRRFAASTETSVQQLDLFTELLAEALMDDPPRRPWCRRSLPALRRVRQQPPGVTADGGRCRQHCHEKPSGMIWRMKRRRAPAVADLAP